MAMSVVVMGEVVVVGEFFYFVVDVMNNDVFFWVSTTTSLFEIFFNHPTGQTLLAKRAFWVCFKVGTIAICIMAHFITDTDLASKSWFCQMKVFPFFSCVGVVCDYFIIFQTRATFLDKAPMRVSPVALFRALFSLGTETIVCFSSVVIQCSWHFVPCFFTVGAIQGIPIMCCALSRQSPTFK